jgi:hypothetical protein
MTRSEIIELIRSLPADERLAELIITIVERRSEAMAAPISMAAVITAMAQYLNRRDRIALAEILRDAADRVEHRREVVRID